MNNKNVRYRKKYFITIPMTTIIGIKCIDGIAIGSDSQLTISGDNPAKETDFDKIYKMNKTLVACAGDTDYFEKVRNEINKRYTSEFKNIDKAVNIVESSVKYIYDNYPHRDDDFSEILFSTSIRNKTYLFRIDSYHCFALKIEDFYPIGTGGVFAKYILKRVWDDNLTLGEAIFILSYVINETTKIDQYSNPPIHIAVMSREGLVVFLEKGQIDRVLHTLSLVDDRIKSYFKDLIIESPSSVKTTVKPLLNTLKENKKKIKDE